MVATNRGREGSSDSGRVAIEISGVSKSSRHGGKHHGSLLSVTMNYAVIQGVSGDE